MDACTRGFVRSRFRFPLVERMRRGIMSLRDLHNTNDNPRRLGVIAQGLASRLTIRGADIGAHDFAGLIGALRAREARRIARLPEAQGSLIGSGSPPSARILSIDLATSLR